jgi:predicted nucleic acid-binding protein
MTDPCFVDANVFVYSRDPRDRRKQELAAQWLDHLWRERQGRTSAQAMAEFYAALSRKLGVAPAIAWQYVERYFAWSPQAVDEELLRRARDIEARYKLSWWDSMIVAAAQLQGCVLLLTEDLQDGAVFGAVTTRSPFTLQVREAVAAYRVERRGVPLHRPRGRPKRAAMGTSLT